MLYGWFPAGVVGAATDVMTGGGLVGNAGLVVRAGLVGNAGLVLRAGLDGNAGPVVSAGPVGVVPVGPREPCPVPFSTDEQAAIRAAAATRIPTNWRATAHGHPPR